MADLKSKKNDEVLKRARKHAANKARTTKYAKIEDAHFRDIQPQRTSKTKGVNFEMKGKPKQISGGRPNFKQVPKGTGVPAVRVNTLPKAPKLPSKALTTTVDKTSRAVAKRGLKTGAKKIGKGLLKGAGFAGMFFQEELGRGSDVPYTESPEYKKQLEEDNALPLTSLEDKAAVIKDNKEAIIESVYTNPDLDKDQKKQVIDHVKSDSSIDSTANAVKKREAKGIDGELEAKELSTADQFKEALMFFAPQLLAGAIGGALEGEEGVVAGFKAGGEARESFLDYKQNQFENKLKNNEATAKKAKAVIDSQAQDLQQARDFSYKLPDGTIAPVSINMETDEKLHPITHEPLTPDQHSNLISGESRRAKSLEHRITEDAQFEAKQFASQTNYNKTRGSLDAINLLFNETNPQTGQVTGRYNDLQALMGNNPNQYAELKVEATNVMAKFIHGISGTAAAKEEVKRLMGAVPNTLDGAKIFEAKLSQFRNIIVREQRLELMTIARTQPLKRELAYKEIERLNDEEEVTLPKHVLNKIGPSSSDTQSVPTDKDIDDMTDAEVKAYMGVK